jgi:hypothetical protein
MSNKNPKVPENKGRNYCRVNAMSLAQLLKFLSEGIYSCKELAQESGLHYVTVLTYTREMYRAGVLYVKAWEKDVKGIDQIRIYAFGNKPDAKKQKLSSVEKQRRHRQKKQQMKVVQMMAGDSKLCERKPKAQRTQEMLNAP